MKTRVELDHTGNTRTLTLDNQILASVRVRERKGKHWIEVQQSHPEWYPWCWYHDPERANYYASLAVQVLAVGSICCHARGERGEEMPPMEVMLGITMEAIKLLDQNLNRRDG